MNTNEAYAEYLVSRKNSSKDQLMKILLVCGVFLLTSAVLIIGFLFLPQIAAIAIVVAGGIIYGGYILLTGFDVEYEYTVSCGEIDVDKIKARKKRKALITAKISSFEAFGKISDAPPTPSSLTIVEACEGLGENDYYADFRHDSLGNVRLIFTPNEKMLNLMKIYLPRNLKRI